MLIHKHCLHLFCECLPQIGLTLRPHVNLDNDCLSVDREFGTVPCKTNGTLGDCFYPQHGSNLDMRKNMPSKKAFLKHCRGEMQLKGNLTCEWNILGNILNFIIESICHLVEIEDQGGSGLVPQHKSFKVTVTYTCKNLPNKDICNLML